MQATVDYALARRAVLAAFRAGQTSRPDICDAHDDLLRAARYSGEPSPEPCPVCGGPELVLLSYAFSDEMPKRENGRVWPRGDLAPLLEYREARVYTVEVCTDCCWNHLRSQVCLQGRRVRRGREASK